MTWSRFPKAFLLTVWSVMMTALTAVIGAAPLRGLRGYAGPVTYWILVTGFAGALFAFHVYALAVGFLGLGFLVGIFSEVEETDHSSGWSAFFAILLTSLIGLGAMALWVGSIGRDWYGQLLTLMELPITQLTQLNADIQLTAEDLLMQVPSAIVILMLFGLYIAILFEKRTLRWVGEKPSKKRNLTTFRVPDLLIWVFLAAMLGAFFDHEVRWLEVVSVNILNVSLVLYFFQGLAVIADAFARLKVGLLWQILGYALLIFQLFVVVCVIGIADFWFEFRNRWSKKEKINRVNKEFFKK